jgi:triacylglycerol lipase
MGPCHRGTRRWLGAGVALLVAMALTGSIVAAVRDDGSPPQHAGSHRAVPATSPPATRAPTTGQAAPRQDRPRQDRLGPVLLVPGYGGSTSSLDSLAGRIRASGRRATVVHLAGAGTGSLLADAALLNTAVNLVLSNGAPSVDVIGYSAGGVVALIWARRDDGVARARRIITLGAPFHGTQLAAAAAALLPGDCPAACRQLVPGSALLTSLDVARAAGLPRWLSLWTADDEVVMPPASARLPGAIDVPVQAVCPAVDITHTQLPTSPVVVTMVLAALGRGPLTPPTAADCH